MADKPHYFVHRKGTDPLTGGPGNWISDGESTFLDYAARLEIDVKTLLKHVSQQFTDTWHRKNRPGKGTAGRKQRGGVKDWGIGAPTPGTIPAKGLVFKTAGTPGFYKRMMLKAVIVTYEKVTSAGVCVRAFFACGRALFACGRAFFACGCLFLYAGVLFLYACSYLNLFVHLLLLTCI